LEITWWWNFNNTSWSSIISSLVLFGLGFYMPLTPLPIRCLYIFLLVVSGFLFFSSKTIQKKKEEIPVEVKGRLEVPCCSQSSEPDFFLRWAGTNDHDINH
jgi:hypothetical protein